MVFPIFNRKVMKRMDTLCLGAEAQTAGGPGGTAIITRFGSVVNQSNIKSVLSVCGLFGSV